MGRAGRPKGSVATPPDGSRTKTSPRRERMLEMREALRHLKPLPRYTHGKLRGRRSLLREKRKSA